MPIVHLAMYDGLADWEYGYVAAGINNPEFQRAPADFRIVTVGATGDPITTMGGLTIVPDTTLDRVDATDSALLVLPGASTWETGNDDFAQAACHWVAAGIPVAGICGATVGLARVGLLDERAHTSNAPAQLAPTGYAGAAHYVDAPAVNSGGVITAGAVAPVEFAREIFAELAIYEPAVLRAWYQLYGEHDPAGFYALSAR